MKKVRITVKRIARYDDLIAEYVTVGTDFVQNVKKMTNPTETTWEIASGVFVPSTMWYELAD
ncbi:MAG: hypothetical protein IKP74_02980 [Clostridia bacterium]|nr:hypothetical protein [Clostridia bacterium]